MRKPAHTWGYIGIASLIAAGAALYPLAAPAIGAGPTPMPAYRLSPFAPLAALGKDFHPVALDATGTVLGYTERLVPGAGTALVARTRIYLLPAGGRLREVPEPAGVSDLVPNGMNNRGEIIGETEGDAIGYVYRHGAWGFVGPDGQGEPVAINDRGQITGIVGVNDGNYAFLGDDRGGPLRTLGTLPCHCATRGQAFTPAGDVFGAAFTREGDWRAALFPANGGPARDLQTLAGARQSAIMAANGQGVAAGTATFASGDHVIRYDGIMRDVGFIQGLPVLTIAGIDARGRIVGTAQPNMAARNQERAFLAGTGGIEDLTTLAGLPAGSIVREAVAVNGAGQILALADLGHGPIPTLLAPTRPDAGGPADAGAVFSRVAWQPTPTPVPTAMTAPPAALAGTWIWFGPAVPDGWPQGAVLQLALGPGMTVHGTITAGGQGYAVAGSYTPPAADAPQLFAGGTIALSWTVPAAGGGPPAGLYTLQVQFPADFHQGIGTYKTPTGMGGMSLRRAGTQAG